MPRVLAVLVSLLLAQFTCAQCAYPVYPPVYRHSPTVYYFPQRVEPAKEPAKVVLLLPPDAELFCNDTSYGRKDDTKRTFNTPPLKVGQSYYYDMRIEVNEGKVSKSKRVYVKAGETTTVDLRFPPPKVLDKDKFASITVKLLPDTELFYKGKNDAEWKSLGNKGATRNFTVQAGDQDEVQLKAVTKGPPKVERSATVKFRGGDEREVDLSYEEKK